MKIHLSHPTGNRNVREIMTALENGGHLSQFSTTIAVSHESDFLKVLPQSIKKELLRRNYPIPFAKIQTHPVKEFARMILPKIGLKHMVNHEKAWASIDSVYSNLDLFTSKQLNKDTSNAVYAYEDGALQTFIKAKSLGLKCIYELPIAYWETSKRLLTEESKRVPAWAGTLGRGINPTVEKLERKSRELELADVVIGPGEFVMNSIPAWARDKKMIVSPFGSPSITNAPRPEYTGNQPFRILFAGSMSQRKGLADLFEAIKILNRSDVELIVMGSLLSPMEFYRSQLANFKYEPGRPNDQVLALMRTCDVFCLPSIVEGRALVMQEAMSQGLPLIITPNTGGADLVKEGITGFEVPIRSPYAIAEKIEWFIDNRAQLPVMRKETQKHAENYTWEKYGQNIVNQLKEYI